MADSFHDSAILTAASSDFTDSISEIIKTDNQFKQTTSSYLLIILPRYTHVITTLIHFIHQVIDIFLLIDRSHLLRVIIRIQDR